MNRLVVLGGSTPFTAALVDALVERADFLPAQVLVLHGRSKKNLEILARYAKTQLCPLGWQVEFSLELRSVLENADIVIHQVRYGGIAARDRAEKLSLAFGLTPDETLGPGALYSALELMPELDQMTAVLVRECPTAWVLNLTNPLSLTTARMIRQGIAHCVGLCELPLVTYREAATILGKDPGSGDWSYVGFKHRGFISQLGWDGQDYIRDFAEALKSNVFSGISGDDIAALGALPTKYFELLSRAGSQQGTGRSEFLAQLRLQILEELRADPDHSPPSLKKRYMAWYKWSVVPLIEALQSEQASLQVVNQLGHDGLVEEGRAWVSKRGVGPLVNAVVGVGVTKWLDRLRQHEDSMMAAITQPSLDSVARALEADPLVREDQVGECAQLIWHKLEAVNQERSQRTGE